MTIPEQLDALTLSSKEVGGWSILRLTGGYLVSVRIFPGADMRNVFGEAPTLPEAAEKATVEAMKAIHEGRREDG